MGDDRHIRRARRAQLTFRALGGFAAVCALGVAASQGATAAPSGSQGGLQVQVRSSSQSAILATGRVRVRVASPDPGTVRLSPRVRSGRARAQVAGRALRVRVRDTSLVVPLRLSAAGRAALSGCGAKRIVVRASFRPAPEARAEATRAKSKGSRALQVDAAGCPAPGSPALQALQVAAGRTRPTHPRRSSTSCHRRLHIQGRRLTPPTPTAATSSTQPSASSPGPTTTSPSRTPTYDTGRRLDLNLLSMPQNAPAASASTSADRPDRPQPGRRLQPGQPDRHQGSGPRDPGGVRQQRPRLDRPPRALRRHRPAGGRDQRRHRRAPPGLGRDRLEPARAPTEARGRRT